MTGEPTTAYPGFGNYGPAGSTAPSDTRPTRRPLAWNGGTDIGLLLLRLGIGGVVFAHGAQKVFGLWGGTGIAGFATNLEGLGYQQATTLSWLTGVTELIAGAFLVLGLLTPLAAAAVLAIMINAVLLKLGNGFFVTGPKGSDAIELSARAGPRRRVPGAHRARADRARQRARLAPAARVVGRAGARHRRRRGRARLRPPATTGDRLTSDDAWPERGSGP